MASGSYEDSVEEDLTCPLCFELFVDPHTPKELDCPHIQCVMCLEQITDGWKPTIECPECRMITNVPPEGLDGLKTNLRIRSLAEKHFTHIQKRKDSSHDKQPDLSGVPVCPYHSGEKVHFYCTTCKATACQACIVLKHEPRSRHAIKDINEVYFEQEEEMKMILVKAEKDAGKWETAARVVEDQEENYKLLLMMEEQKIDTLVESVQEQGRALKEELQSRSSGHLENFERHREELLQMAQDIHKAATDAKKVTATASCHDYVTKHDELAKNIIKKTMQQPQKFEDKYSPPETLKFKPNPNGLKLGSLETIPEQKLGISNQKPDMEHLSTDSHDESIPLLKIFQNKTRKLTQIQEIRDCKRELSGIAVGQDGTLSVCSKYHGVIQIYNRDRRSQKYKKHRNFKLPVRAWGPQDVTVSQNGDHLVARMQCIEVYDQTGVYKGDIQTQANQDSGSFGVSCITSTPDRQIVAGDKDLKHITVHQSGDFVTFKIGVVPDRLAPIASKQVAIASRENGVSVIDLKSGKTVLGIIIPKAYGICYDQQTNSLLVGRQDDRQHSEAKGVIEQYSCASGEMIARIAHGLIHPKAMAYLSDGVLAVADANIVKIYKVV